MDRQAPDLPRADPNVLKRVPEWPENIPGAQQDSKYADARCSRRCPGAFQQSSKIELDRRLNECRLTFDKWTAYITRLVRKSAGNRDNSQDKFFRFMQRRDHLLASDHQGIRTINSSLHLNEAKVAGLRIERG